MGMIESIKFQKVHAHRGRALTSLPAVSYKRTAKKIVLRIDAGNDIVRTVGIKRDTKVNLYVGEAKYLMIDLDESEGQFKVRGNKPPSTVLTIETAAVSSIPLSCLPESSTWRELHIVEHEYVHVIVSTNSGTVAKSGNGEPKSPAKPAAPASKKSVAEVDKPRRGRPRKNA